MDEPKFYAVATRRNPGRRYDIAWYAQCKLGVRLRFTTERAALHHARLACADDATLLYPRAERAA